MEREGRKAVGIRDTFHKIIVRSVTCSCLPCARVDDGAEKTLSAGKVGTLPPAPAILGLKPQNSWHFCNFKLLKYYLPLIRCLGLQVSRCERD